MVDAFTYSDFQIAETQLLSDVDDAIRNATDNLIELSSDLEQVEVRQAVEKSAHLEAINFITDHAEQMLTGAFMEALFSSVEYNHELFIGRSVDAIQAHWHEVLFVVPQSPGKVIVDIDFEPVGNIQTYEAAVAHAREALGFKMTSAPESRSIYWARNIYGVDREGGAVRVTPAGHRKSKDVTVNYLGKWTKTVTTRLSYLEAGTAPWWYLINHGNIDAFSESSGMPYPVVEATHFIEKLETQIKEIFDRIYRESLDEWEEWYADMIADDYGIKQFDDFDQIAQVIEPEIVKKIEKQEELEPTNKALGTITQDGKVYDLYVSAKGKISRRYSLSKN